MCLSRAGRITPHVTSCDCGCVTQPSEIPPRFLSPGRRIRAAPVPGSLCQWCSLACPRSSVQPGVGLIWCSLERPRRARLRSSSRVSGVTEHNQQAGDVRPDRSGTGQRRLGANSEWRRADSDGTERTSADSGSGGAERGVVAMASAGARPWLLLVGVLAGLLVLAGAGQLVCALYLLLKAPRPAVNGAAIAAGFWVSTANCHRQLTTTRQSAADQHDIRAVSRVHSH